MASLFADENFPLPVTQRLRTLGHDVLTTGDVGMSNRRIPDDIVLEFATRLDRAVLTVNRRDFLDLHERGVGHCGIVACRDDPDFEALARRVHAGLSGEITLAGRFVEIGS